MKKSLIYTGGGDKGTTSLVGGVRVPKTHPRLEAYGTIDELNSQIGLLIAETDDQQTADLLRFVQHKLFTVGSYLATDMTQTDLRIQSNVTPESIRRLEEAIDRYDTQLPRMRGFVLPEETAHRLWRMCVVPCVAVPNDAFIVSPNRQPSKNQC